MTPLILLGVIAAVTLVLALFLRVNAVFLFLSVAAGRLFVTNVGDDADLALGMAVRQGDTAVMAQLILQLLPVVFTLFFLRKTIPAHKSLFQILPLISIGLMLSALVLPILPESMQSQVYATDYGETIRSTQDVVISVAALLTLFLAWFSYRHKEEKKKHKK